MLLLEEAQNFKGFQPIAFLVHGAHKASSAGDSEKFALIAEHLEMALLGCCDGGADIDDESLEHIAKALGEGVERSQLLGTLKGVGECAGFGNVCWRLKMAISGMRTHTEEAESGVRRLVELMDGTTWQSDPAVESPTSPFEAPKPAAAAAASAESAEGPTWRSVTRPSLTTVDAIRQRRQRTSYEDRSEAQALAAQTAAQTAAEMEAQTALLRERNRVLKESVAQMQSMLTAGNAMQRSMIRLVGGRTGIVHAEFMARYPLPASEAERRVALKTSGLLRIADGSSSERDQVTELVASLAHGDALSGLCELVGMVVTLMGAEEQRLVTSLARSKESGRFESTEVQAGFGPIPRKCTKCQHVIAAGETVCIKGGRIGAGALAASPVGADLVSMKTTEQLVPSLMLSDDSIYKSAMTSGGQLAEIFRAQKFGREYFRLRTHAFRSTF